MLTEGFVQGIKSPDRNFLEEVTISTLVRDLGYAIYRVGMNILNAPLQLMSPVSRYIESG